MPKKTTKVAEKREQLIENIEFIRYSLREFDDRKYIVGIDPSLTNTAVAVTTPKTRKVLLFNSPAAAKDTSLSQTHRIAITRSYLRKIFKKYPARLVMLEGYSYASAMVRELMGEVGNAIRLCVFWDNPESVGPVVIVTPQQLKKYILGKSRGTSKGKEKIMMKVLQDFQIETDNNNEADAAVLAVIGRDLYTMLADPKMVAPTTDKQAMEFIKDGYKSRDLKQFRWEVLCSLLTSRCDDSIFDFFNRKKFDAARINDDTSAKAKA